MSPYLNLLKKTEVGGNFCSEIWCISTEGFNLLLLGSKCDICRFRSVGDPFKDTAGPSIHVLIKMLATITLVMAPIFL